MSDSSPSTTCTITCAACGRQEVRPTLRAVYGEDNPFPGDDGDAPYADRPGTGWIAALGVYFCPVHVDRPESWGEEMARWEAKLEEHRALFEEKFKLHTPPPSLRLEDGGGDVPMSNPLSLPVHLSDWKLTPTTTLDGLQRAVSREDRGPMGLLRVVPCADHIDIPRLLRRWSPVILPDGYITVVIDPALMTVLHVDGHIAPCHDIGLDLWNATGRWHAALWAADRLSSAVLPQPEHDAAAVLILNAQRGVDMSDEDIDRLARLVLWLDGQPTGIGSAPVAKVGRVRADGAGGGVAATKWPADVSLFVNDDGDGTQIDVWHDGVCGGPMLIATSAESARAIIGAIDELHGLRERLADFQADYHKVMSDQCAPDERHCSCVPHLRARIAELERERVDLINGADLAADRANRHRQERDAARVEIAHLQDTLIKLREGAPTPPATPAPPDPNALPGGGEGAVTALLMDYGIVDTPETRQQMRDTLMSALRAGAGPDGYYPLRTTEDTGAPAWLRLNWAGASIDPVPYTEDTLPRPASPYVPEPPSRVGGRWVSPSRVRVLVNVHDERERQDRKFGRDRNHPLAYSGFRGRPQDLCAAYGVPSAQEAQARCDAAMKAGRVTYGHILVEEVCEVFEAAAEGDMVAVRKELVQVVAVGVAAIEALDRAEGR